MIKVAVIGGTNCLVQGMELTSKYDDYDILIVSFMSCTMLAGCSLGLDNDFAKAFLNNKPIYVIKSGLQYKRICDKVVYQMYCTYAQRLKSFGVKFIESVKDIKL